MCHHVRRASLRLPHRASTGMLTLAIFTGFHAHNVTILYRMQTIAVGRRQVKVMNRCNYDTTAFLHQFHELQLILNIKWLVGSSNTNTAVCWASVQAMVKEKRHICFFIVGIGLVNLMMGLALYYGIATWGSKYFEKIIHAYRIYVYRASANGGVPIFTLGVRLILKTKWRSCDTVANTYKGSSQRRKSNRPA